MVFKIFRKIYFVFYRLGYWKYKKRLKEYNIASIDQTIEKLNDSECGISRFGDGEIKWLLKDNSNSFQEPSVELSKKLEEVLRSDLPNLLIGLPDAFLNTTQLVPSAKRFWRIMIVKYGSEIEQKISKNTQYYNANISRNYIDYKDKSISTEYLDKIKKIWKNREVLIVEGEMTKMGVGNDLFDEVSSVERIICPPTNAFSKYSEILKAVKDVYKKNNKKLIILSLGPTATILAYDLAKEGIRAIDIGQIDIEYEWLLNGVTKKEPVLGKYVNEVSDGKIDIEDIGNEKYESEVVYRVVE